MTRENDGTLRYMLENNIPLTKENYLSLEYLGRPPKELDTEDELDLPNELRLPEYRDDPEDEGEQS